MTFFQRARRKNHLNLSAIFPVLLIILLGSPRGQSGKNEAYPSSLIESLAPSNGVYGALYLPTQAERYEKLLTHLKEFHAMRRRRRFTINESGPVTKKRDLEDQRRRLRKLRLRKVKQFIANYLQKSKDASYDRDWQDGDSLLDKRSVNTKRRRKRNVMTGLSANFMDDSYLANLENQMNFFEHELLFFLEDLETNDDSLFAMIEKEEANDRDDENRITKKEFKRWIKDLRTELQNDLMGRPNVRNGEKFGDGEILRIS